MNILKHAGGLAIKTMQMLIVLMSLLVMHASGQHQSIDSLENSLIGMHESSDRVATYTLLAKHYQLVDVQRARQYAYRALELSQKAGITDYAGEIYGCLGDIAVIEDSLELARQYYEYSLEFFLEDGSSSDLAGVTMVLGNIANVQDDLTGAMIYYLKAIAYAEEGGLKTWLDDLHLNIAILDIKAGKPEEAQKYLAIALEIARETNDSLSEANVYDNFGLTYLQYGDLSLAREYLNKALEIYHAKLEYQRIAQTYDGLSQLERRDGKYREALRMLDSATFYLDKKMYSYSPSIHLRSSIMAEKGKNYASLGLRDSARKFFREAYYSGKKNRQMAVLADATGGLSALWADEGDFDSAYAYHLLHKNYADSILNEENIREMAYLDARYTYEQQLADEKRSREEQAAREKRNIIWLLIIITGLLLALVILVLFLQLNRNKMKRLGLERKNLEMELEVRNKELNTHVMYQLKKNEFILDISRKLGQLVKDLKSENRKVVRDVIRQLDSDTSDEVWKEFEVRFHRVHTGFYKSLTKDFPDLTTNELRLCAFLRLNMNTKDISAITYQSTNSIDVARSRLRQKFGLGKDENLSAFLSKY